MTKSKITIAIRFHLLQVWPSELRFFVFSVSLIHSFNVLSVYFIFLCFIEFGGSFYPLLNFNFSGEKKKNRRTSILRSPWYNERLPLS